MSASRIGKPDTPADLELRDCLIADEARCFSMVAGAGSGKTTSLVKALSTLVSSKGDTLRARRQRIACITYTDIAAGEIWSDVGNDSLVHVSTIHSFLWMIARSFQRDIKAWALRRIDQRIEDLAIAAAGFGPRVHQRTRDKNQRDSARYAASKADVERIRAFTYGTGSDYPKGILGHDDILKLATDLLREKSLFRTLVAQQFPYIFVDESQDTQQIVVDALKAAAAEPRSRLCLGFFGDPMQQIYPTGIGSIPLEPGWVQIEKEQNFRCPTTVLAVANAIRRGGDDLVQTGGRTEEVDDQPVAVEGSARIFILPTQNRLQSIASVRNWVAQQNHDEAWRDGDPGLKLLVIVHRMAAARLGFGELYEAMNDQAPAAFKDGFLDATAWPLRPFETLVLPIVEAVEAGREFEVMTLLRKQCPLLAKEAIPAEGVSDLLAKIRTATHGLRDIMAPGGPATVRDVLVHLRDQQLTTLDPRVLQYIEEGAAPILADEPQADDDQEAAREIASMDRYLGCPAVQLRGFHHYIQELSPFSTQQGVKGAEFERVLVVLDDDEGTHVQFSYDKYFGVVPPSPRDLENVREGKPTTIERTRRLFYVCCTRALKDLVVVYFSNTPAEAERQVRAAGIFPDAQIYNAASLQAA